MSASSLCDGVRANGVCRGYEEVRSPEFVDKRHGIQIPLMKCSVASTEGRVYTQMFRAEGLGFREGREAVSHTREEYWDCSSPRVWELWVLSGRIVGLDCGGVPSTGSTSISVLEWAGPKNGFFRSKMARPLFLWDANGGGS